MPRLSGLPALLTLTLLAGTAGLYCVGSPAQAQNARSLNRQRDPNGIEPTSAGSRLTYAVVDFADSYRFADSDRETGPDIAKALITEMDEGQNVPTIGRVRVIRALRDLGLAADDLFSASDVRRLCRQLGVDRLVVGAYSLDDNDLTLRAQILDGETGRIAPGGTVKIVGDRRDLSEMASRLARTVRRRSREAELGDNSAVRDVAAREVAVSAADSDDASAWERLQTRTLIPTRARPNAILTERDLTGLVQRIGYELAIRPSARLITVANSNLPVTRLRALAALEKLTLSASDVQKYKGDPNDPLTPDAVEIPQWGLPFVAAAIDQGWWRADRAIHARETATWGYVKILLARMPLLDEARPEPRSVPRVETAPRPAPAIPPSDDVETENLRFTGLVIDARDFHVQRSMSPRILDEDGKVVYPDVKNLPSLDYIEDHGIAEYFYTIEDAKRAGDNPLVLHALSTVSENGHDDVIISNAAAERIRRACRRHNFLAGWAVAIVTPRE